MIVSKSTDALKILHMEDHFCVKITSFQSYLSRCLGCVLKDIAGARMVIISALKNAVILIDPSDGIPDCSHRCTRTEELAPAECKIYLVDHMINIEMHREQS